MLFLHFPKRGEEKKDLQEPQDLKSIIKDAKSSEEHT